MEYRTNKHVPTTRNIGFSVYFHVTLAYTSSKGVGLPRRHGGLRLFVLKR
jgi:hypothetical protein